MTTHLRGPTASCSNRVAFRCRALSKRFGGKVHSCPLSERLYLPAVEPSGLTLLRGRPEAAHCSAAMRRCTPTAFASATAGPRRPGAAGHSIPTLFHRAPILFSRSLSGWRYTPGAFHCAPTVNRCAPARPRGCCCAVLGFSVLFSHNRPIMSQVIPIRPIGWPPRRSARPLFL